MSTLVLGERGGALRRQVSPGLGDLGTCWYPGGDTVLCGIAQNSTPPINSTPPPIRPKPPETRHKRRSLVCVFMDDFRCKERPGAQFAQRQATLSRTI